MSWRGAVGDEAISLTDTDYFASLDSKVEDYREFPIFVQNDEVFCRFPRSLP